MLTTTVVGSYPQPRWLLNHEILTSNAVPRIRMREMWRVAEPHLEEAQDDAVRLAVRDMERAGIDIVTDGEQRRESDGPDPHHLILPFLPVPPILPTLASRSVETRR